VSTFVANVPDLKGRADDRQALAPCSDAPSAPSAPSAGAPPLWKEIDDAGRRAGLTRVDMTLLAAIYALVVLGFVLAWSLGRVGHAEAWRWGVHLMNVPLAACGAALLALATIAAAAAFRLACRHSRWPKAAALSIALLGCLGFITTLAVDVDVKWTYGIRPGAMLRPNERYVARRFHVKLPPSSAAPVAPLAAPRPVARAVDAAHGRKLFLNTCMSCHGGRGEGMPGQGKALIANEFVGKLDDAKLVDFLKVGRAPWDPANTTKVQMPPRGGNPMLTDDDLRDVAAFVRTLQTTPAASPAGQAAVAPAGSATPAPLTEPSSTELLLSRWVVSPPPVATQGVSSAYLAEVQRALWKPPRDAAAFVNGYYAAVQFGGLHAGLLAVFLGVLLVQSLRGRVVAGRRAGVAMAAAGCLVMTLAWLALFPFVFLQ